MKTDASRLLSMFTHEELKDKLMYLYDRLVEQDDKDAASFAMIATLIGEGYRENTSTMCAVVVTDADNPEICAIVSAGMTTMEAADVLSSAAEALFAREADDAPDAGMLN